MGDNAFGPNEERYKKASEPHHDKESAEHALHLFYQDLGLLREKHKIPEVVIVSATYYGDKKLKTACMASAFGNSATWPELAAAAYRMYVLPIIERAVGLTADTTPKRRRGG